MTRWLERPDWSDHAATFTIAAAWCLTAVLAAVAAFRIGVEAGRWVWGLL